MHVAVVETAPVGGLLHYATQLADGLAEAGDDVDLIVARGNELSERDGAARRLEILPATVRGTELPKSRLAYLARRAGVALRLAGAWIRAIAAVRRGRYDAVIVNADMTLSLSAAFFLVLTLLPRRGALAAVCHNVQPYNRGEGDLHSSSGLLRRLLAAVYPRLDVVFVHGEQSRQEFEEVWPPSNLALVPHGDERIFADEPPAPSTEERALFFGDWRKVKGLDILMEAFDRLSQRRPSVRLTVAGTPAPGDFDPELVRGWAKKHSGAVELDDRYIPIPEVPAIFGRARVVVAPYRVAYQSGVVHLAMTMARAVVASDAGDLPNAVVDGETGVVVPVADVDALADALERVLGDPDLANRLGQAGHARVMSHSGWETVAERVHAALGARDG